MSKTNKFLFLSLTVIFLLLTIGVVKKSKQKIPKITSSKPTVQTTKNPDSKVNEGGNVTVTVKPKALKIGEKPVFEINFETHLVDLSFDVTKISLLVDDQGKTYTQSVWAGSPPGGHHREGTLTFDTVLPKTKFVELTLKDVAGVTERKFKWNL